MITRVLALAAAVAALPLAVQAAPQLFTFAITSVTQGTTGPEAAIVPITGSFILDTDTPSLFSGASAVDDLAFTLTTGDPDLDIADFRYLGSNLFGVGPQITIRNDAADPGALVQLRFARDGSSLFALVQSGGTFSTVGTAPGANAYTIADVSPAAAIPLPAGGVLLVGALGGLTALRRRRP